MIGGTRSRREGGKVSVQEEAERLDRERRPDLKSVKREKEISELEDEGRTWLSEETSARNPGGAKR